MNIGVINFKKIRHGDVYMESASQEQKYHDFRSIIVQSMDDTNIDLHKIREEIEDAYTDGEITGSAYDNLIYLVDELI